MKIVKIINYNTDYLTPSQGVDFIVGLLRELLSISIDEAVSLFTNACRRTVQTIEVIDCSILSSKRLESIGFNIVILQIMYLLILLFVVGAALILFGSIAKESACDLFFIIFGFFIVTSCITLFILKQDNSDDRKFIEYYQNTQNVIAVDSIDVLTEYDIDYINHKILLSRANCDSKLVGFFYSKQISKLDLLNKGNLKNLEGFFEDKIDQFFNNPKYDLKLLTHYN